MPSTSPTTSTGLRRTPPTRTRPSAKSPARPDSEPCRRVFATPSKALSFAGQRWGLFRQAPIVLPDSAETRYFKGMFMMHRNKQSILQRTIHMAFGALVLASPLAGQTASSQKPPVKAAQDYTRNVDPFIGVDWGGNTFVGSAIPYGLVKVGPDMETFDGR